VLRYWPRVSTHELPASELSTADAYRLMTDLVAPRPIAWVSTVDGEGRANLAPFSYFQAVCSSPPTIVLGIAWLPSGRPKDTLANILATGELTINHVSEDLAERMNATSASFASGVSEWASCGVDSAPAVAVAPRRVAAARAGLECRLTHAIPLGASGSGKRGVPSSTMVVAEVVHVWTAADLIERDERGRLLPISPAKLASVARLGGISYSTTAGHFDLARPQDPR
jgi:flavin reductase (DIM6/NTAB) family NADH-FMN oxidoreductase RutF